MITYLPSILKQTGQTISPHFMKRLLVLQNKSSGICGCTGCRHTGVGNWGLQERPGAGQREGAAAPGTGAEIPLQPVKIPQHSQGKK